VLGEVVISVRSVCYPTDFGARRPRMVPLKSPTRVLTEPFVPFTTSTRVWESVGQVDAAELLGATPATQTAVTSV
jgi:hypothetical protein